MKLVCFARGSVVRGGMSRGESLPEVSSQKRQGGDQPNTPGHSYASSERGTKRKNLLSSKQGSQCVQAGSERVVARVKK